MQDAVQLNDNSHPIKTTIGQNCVLWFISEIWSNLLMHIADYMNIISFDLT